MTVMTGVTEKYYFFVIVYKRIRVAISINIAKKLFL